MTKPEIKTTDEIGFAYPKHKKWVSLDYLQQQRNEQSQKLKEQAQEIFKEHLTRLDDIIYRYSTGCSKEFLEREVCKFAEELRKRCEE